jgi:hypothetical protein
MLPFLSRGCLGALMVLQTVQPAMAWYGHVIEGPCCCEVEWDCCYGDFLIERASCGCEGEQVAVNECGCGSEPSEPALNELPEQPEPAQSNKPEASATETPQPALDPREELPPAPINVPTTSTAETDSDELFPGPAAETPSPAGTEPTPSTPVQSAPADGAPPTTPATGYESLPSDGAGALFDEPAAETQPPPAAEPAATTPAPAAEDEVFGETSQPADVSPAENPVVEEETIEEESTEIEGSEAESTEQPAADPLDDLFGPSSSLDKPDQTHEVAARLETAGGLAIIESRQWSSRNGDFQCHGRLVRMTANGVFVIQPNGELMAIAFAQLSDADLAFVRGQLQTQRDLLAQQEADSQIASRNVR